VEWQVLNAKNFGVPQNRERVFIVGHLGGIPSRKVFPIRGTTETNLRGCEISNSSKREFGFKKVSPCLAARDYKDPKVVQVADYRNDEGLRIRSEPISPCLSARRTSATDISTMPPVILRGRPKMPYEQGKRELEYKTYDKIVPTLSTNPASGDAKNMVVQAVLTPDRLNKRQNGRRFKEDGEESFTLTAQDRHGVFNGTRIRRLTPLECERLMGYPDNWTEGLSDTQRYKTLGNGIVSNVVAEVVKRLTNKVEKK
jgi:DNA (cytosine-5)-methyltransferase 1